MSITVRVYVCCTSLYVYYTACVIDIQALCIRVTTVVYKGYAAM
jgi:hypothetical protein